MPQCADCKRNDAVMTLAERFRWWLFWHFGKEVKDLGDDKYTKGYGEGYRQGYAHAREVSATQAQYACSLDALTRQLHNSLELKTTVKVSDIIQASQDKSGKIVVTLGGQPISDEQARELKGEAEWLLRSRIWSILTETLRSMAIDTSVKKSKDFTEVLEGKMMLHDIGLKESIVDVIKNLKLNEEKPRILTS